MYPYAPHAAHVVGYMGAITKEQKDEYLAKDYVLSERVGQFGVELSMESVLHGVWGRRVYEVDAAERPVRLIEEVPPVDGFDVQLTIDLTLQQYAEQALETTLEVRRDGDWPRTPRCSSPTVNARRWIRQLPDLVPYKAPAGSVVVMDYATGQVKALASYPTFDNRWFEAGLSSEKFKQIFPDTEDPDLSILVNRAVQGRYNMGSTFKPFTAYAALNTGLISAGRAVQRRGRVPHAHRRPGSMRRRAGAVRVQERHLQWHPTSVQVRAGQRHRCPRHLERLVLLPHRRGHHGARTTSGRCCRTQVKLFGFGADTGIDLPFEFDGTVPDKELKKRYAELGIISEDEGRGYFAGDNVQLAIGQGLLSATPLQLAVGYATIANQGFVFRPQIVKAIWNPGVPDGEPGSVDLTRGTIRESFDNAELIRQVPMPGEVRLPIVRGPAARGHAGRGGRVGLLPLHDRREPVLRLPGRRDPDRRQDGHRPGRRQLPVERLVGVHRVQHRRGQPVRRDRLPREVGLRIAGGRARGQVHVPRAVGEDTHGARRAVGSARPQQPGAPRLRWSSPTRRATTPGSAGSAAPIE